MTQPVFEHGAQATWSNFQSVQTFTIDAGTNANRFVAFLAASNGSGQDVLTATCNGHAMTLGTQFTSDQGGSNTARAGYLQGDSLIASGNNTIVVNMSTNAHGIFATAGAWSNTDSTALANLNEVTNKNSGSTALTTGAFTSATGNIAAMIGRTGVGSGGGGGGTLTPTSPATTRYDTNASATSDRSFVLDQAGASSSTVAGTWGSSTGWNCVGFNITALTVAATTVQRRTLGQRVGSRQSGFIKLGSGLLAPRRFAAGGDLRMAA